MVGVEEVCWSLNCWLSTIKALRGGCLPRIFGYRLEVIDVACAGCCRNYFGELRST